MVDVFTLWVFLISLLLGPVGAQGTTLDVIDTTDGQVITVTGKATTDGFTFEADVEGARQTVLTAKRVEGKPDTYDLQLQGESQVERVDLHAALAALAGDGAEARTFAEGTRHATVTRRPGQRYLVARDGEGEAARTAVVVRRD